MDTGLTVVEAVVHLANLYLSQKYGESVLETITKTGEFYPTERPLDKRHLTILCPGSQYVHIAINSKRLRSLR